MTPYVADPVYLNGRLLPLAEAGISPLDRGFLYGDGVYEVIPVYSRRAFRIDEHVKRLQATLDGIKLANPLTANGWKEVIGKLIETAPWDDQSIYLQVTRGADDKRDHAFPPASVPSTAFAFASPLVTTPAEVRAKCVAAITVPDLRWSRCDLKVISLLANVLARQQAVEQGCAEALLIRDGLMKEGDFIIYNDGGEFIMYHVCDGLLWRTTGEHTRRMSADRSELVEGIKLADTRLPVVKTGSNFGN